MKPNRLIALIIAPAASGMFSACSSTTTPARPGAAAATSSPAKGLWDAPTTFRFEALTLRQAPKVESVFRARNLLYRRTTDQPLAYEVTGLRDPAQVAQLSKALSEATDQPFESATMTFGGIDTASSAFSNIEIKVTPGAQAFVADGPENSANPWRRVYTDKEGLWKGLVNTTGAVRRQGGWLYVAATKDNLTRYSRINIATRKAEPVTLTRIKDANLPVPGIKPNTQTAETTTSSGFKWPWE